MKKNMKKTLFSSLIVLSLVSTGIYFYSNDSENTENSPESSYSNKRNQIIKKFNKNKITSSEKISNLELVNYQYSLDDNKFTYDFNFLISDNSVLNTELSIMKDKIENILFDSILNKEKVSIKSVLKTEKYSSEANLNELLIEVVFKDNKENNFKENITYFTDKSNSKVLTYSDFINKDNLNNFDFSPDESLLNSDNFAYIDDKKFKIFFTKSKFDYEMKNIKSFLNLGFYQKRIALTFDDGPSEFTDDILNILEKHNAKGTFFLLGSRIESKKDTILSIVEKGHELGNHSWNHDNYSKLSKDKMKLDLLSTNELISEITGMDVYLFRPPYGAHNDDVKKVLEENEMKLALWNIDTLDWSSKDAKKISKQFINDAKEDGVVLMHDIYEQTVIGLDIALTQLEKKGYTFVSYSNLY